MLQHERRFVCQRRQPAKICGIVHRACSGPDLAEMNVHLYIPGQVFGVTTHDPWAQLVETLIEQVCVPVEAAWRVHQVARVHMNRESRSVHCPEHFETTVRAIWKRPPHHFITELCPLRL